MKAVLQDPNHILGNHFIFQLIIVAEKLLGFTKPISHFLLLLILATNLPPTLVLIFWGPDYSVTLEKSHPKPYGLSKTNKFIKGKGRNVCSLNFLCLYDLFICLGSPAISPHF